MAKVILGAKLIEVLSKALNIDGSKIKRMVIDAEFNEPVKVYTEHYGDERLLDVQWSGCLSPTKIIPRATVEVHVMDEQNRENK